MKRTLHLLVLLLIVQQAYAQSFEIKSPDERLILTVNVDEVISWSATLNDNVIINEAIVGMDFSSGVNFGDTPKVKDHAIKHFDEVIRPVVPHKDATIKDKYVELSLVFSKDYQLNFRAYNDGIAY